MIDNKRIAKNTLLLYLRMFLLMGISLYTSRIVLETLGVEDFGVYNIVGSICLLYKSPSPRDGLLSRMPSSA